MRINKYRRYWQRLRYRMRKRIQERDYNVAMFGLAAMLLGMVLGAFLFRTFMAF